MDKFRTVFGILAILCLIGGGILLVSNFSMRFHVLLDPEFLTPQKVQIGLLSLALIATGIFILSRLRRDQFLKRDTSPNKKTPTAIKARQDANFERGYRLFLIGVVVIGILITAFRR